MLEFVKSNQLNFTEHSQCHFYVHIQTRFCPAKTSAEYLKLILKERFLYISCDGTTDVDDQNI